MIFFTSKTGLAILFLFTVIFAFGFRTWICERELDSVRKQTGSDFVPFFVESSIMHDYARAVASGEGIPKHDSQLGPMAEIPLNNQMSLGLEYYLGWTYRIKNMIFGQPKLTPEITIYEDDPYFTNYSRHAIRFWFCLATGFVFLWLIGLHCPWYLALFGSVLHAVSPAAIARYTGQDLLRGNFALPFIVAAFMLSAWLLRKRSPIKTLLLGLTVFCAVSFWDVSQLCFSLWAVIELLRLLITGKFNKKRIAIWTVIYAGIVLAALIVPYCRAHNLLLSPLLVVLIPSLLASGWFGLKSRAKGRITLIISIVLFFAIWKGATHYTGYSKAYSHFGELVKAKIAFKNVKPKDPRALSFSARYLWTPALHSATTVITLQMFPGALACLILLLGGVSAFKRSRKHFRFKIRPYAYLPILLTCCMFFIYIFMVRYHVFAILFSCIAIPLLAQSILESSRRVKTWRIIVGIVLALCLSSAIDADVRRSRVYPQNMLNETSELIRWLRTQDVRDRIILARMTISPLLKNYCDATIILQPKFEMEKTRNLVKSYIWMMYHGDENLLAKFCMDHNIDFVIFDKGDEFGKLNIYSLPYMAAAMKVNKNAPAYLMKSNPDSLKYFYRVPPPKEFKAITNRYVVFRFVTPGIISGQKKWPKWRCTITSRIIQS